LQYKSALQNCGQEFISDRPEVRREEANAMREVASTPAFPARQEHVHNEKKRLGIFSKYLPKIAEFSTTLAGETRKPDIEKLLKSVQKYGGEES
jgi:DNA topoisomerase-6 subunit B